MDVGAGLPVQTLLSNPREHCSLPVSLPPFTHPQTFFNFFCCFIVELASVRINS